MGRTILEVQQDFCNFIGYNQEIIWDLLSSRQDHVLKEKIKNLIADPKRGQGENLEQTKPSSAIQKTRDDIFESVWSQRKYTNRNSLSSIFYVLVTEAEKNQAKESQEFSVHPVFRTRKCVCENDSSKCCMIYVDETGRVYQNWKDYVEENILPKGTMVAPDRGVYTVNSKGVVNLVIYPTPANSLLASTLNIADKTTAGTAIVSSLVAVAALCSVPVAAPLLAASSVMGLFSGGYAAVRAGSNLVDRSSHEQSVSLADRQARSSWLGVAGGIVGLGASRATNAVMTTAAAGGNVSKLSTIVVNGLNISSVVLSGGGVANGVFDIILKYNDDEKIETMDVLQLAASLVLFTHSVRNLRLASSIIQEAQNSRIQSYRDGLSNRQRKIFDKMSKETVRIRGANQGKTDIIRSVNEMPSKQYLNDLHKINRQLNNRRVRPAFGGADKPVVLNNDVSVDPKVLRNSVQHKVGPDVLAEVRQPIPASHSQQSGGNTRTQNRMTSRLFPPNTPTSRNSDNTGTYDNNGTGVPARDPMQDLMNATFSLASGAVISFVELGLSIENVVDAQSFESTLQSLARKLTDECFRLIIDLAKDFIEVSLESIEELIKMKIPREQIMDKLSEIVQSFGQAHYDFLIKKKRDILKQLRDYFRSGETRNSNLTVERLRSTNITLSSGAVISMAEFSDTFFNNITNVDNFNEIVLDMAGAFDENTFLFLMKLSQTFIETDLPNIRLVIQPQISTENVLCKIVEIYGSYTDHGTRTLDEISPEILKALKSNYLQLNTNNSVDLLKKCDICDGFYGICSL